MLPPFPWIDVAIILALVALNGVFAMGELAVVSSRRARMEAMVRAGRPGGGGRQAAADPGKFCRPSRSASRLIGHRLGASFGGRAWGRPPRHGSRRWGSVTLPAPGRSGFALVIGLTTFASLMIGELVPKQFALRSPEPIARWSPSR